MMTNMTTANNAVQMIELSTQQAEEVDGGNLLALAIGAFVFWECMSNARELVQGVQDGFAAGSQ